MNHHEPKLRRANGLLTTRGVPVAALDDRSQYRHDYHHHARDTSKEPKPTMSNTAISPTIGLGAGASTNSGNDDHKTNGSGNGNVYGTPHKRPRPSSLSSPSLASGYNAASRRSVDSALGLVRGQRHPNANRYRQYQGSLRRRVRRCRTRHREGPGGMLGRR